MDSIPTRKKFDREARLSFLVNPSAVGGAAVTMMITSDRHTLSLGRGRAMLVRVSGRDAVHVPRTSCSGARS